jgi:hypothetical protein
MKRPSAQLIGLIAALLTATLTAQQPAPSFRFERPIVPGGAGPRRLPIDVPMLVGGRPFVVSTAVDRQAEPTASGGLTDLRLFGASGQEIGYLLVPNPPLEPLWRAAQDILAIAPVETDREKSSGFEADLGTSRVVDRFRIERVPPPFLKRVRLEGSGDRSRWTVLVAEGTVFDLPEPRLQQTELSFAPGSYRYLRLTWDDARSGRVAQPPAVSAREVSTAVASIPLTTPVTFERRPSEPRRSRFRVRLPAGRLPVVALELDVAGGRIMRDVEVYEARLSGSEAVPVLIGRSTLKRIEQGSLSASSLRVPISTPTELDLDFVVDDGDNPPLDLRAVTAVFAGLPWIYFESDGGAVVARYGNPSLKAPQYDLEAIRASLHIESVMNATWGEPQASGAEERAGSPPPLPTIGAPVDAAGFRYVRDIPSDGSGLVAIRLDEAVLAHSGGVPSRFNDVRVIDRDGRQIPYLVERSAEPMSIEVSLERLNALPQTLASQRGSRTAYRVRWPFEKLPSPRLVLTTAARVFRRPISVVVERAPDRQRRDPWVATLATSTWAHADQETAAPALTLALPTVDARELLVVVDEGDNSPLPIATARLLLPSYRVRLFREEGAALRLAYGRADLAAPTYDLALLAPRMLGVSATELTPGPEREAATRADSSGIVSPRVFWGILAAAVVVLLGLIGRLLRKPVPTP